MIAITKNIQIEKVETQVEIEKTDDKSIFNYRINLGDNINQKDKDFLMNIIDLCAVQQTLSKELVFKLNEWKD